MKIHTLSILLEIMLPLDPVGGRFAKCLDLHIINCLMIDILSINACSHSDGHSNHTRMWTDKKANQKMHISCIEHSSVNAM